MTSNKKRVRLSDIIGPAFYETHKLIDMGVIDEAVESGGRASLKSSYVGTEVVLQLVKHPDCHALVTRQVGDTMRDSVYAQILWAIDKLGLTTKFKCTQSPLQCTYLPPGNAFCSVGWMIRRRSNPSSCRSGISVSCGLRKPTKSRAAKMPCAMCNSLRCAAASLALPLSASTLRLPAATGRIATPARNARASASIIRLPASPCCMARPEVSGAGGVHQGNAADEIPP